MSGGDANILFEYDEPFLFTVFEADVFENVVNVFKSKYERVFSEL